MKIKVSADNLVQINWNWVPSWNSLSYQLFKVDLPRNDNSPQILKWSRSQQPFFGKFLKKELTKLLLWVVLFSKSRKKETIYNFSVCKCLKTVLLNAVLIFIRFFPFALLKKMCFYYKLLLVLSESITLGFFFAQKVFLSSLMQYHK